MKIQVPVKVLEDLCSPFDNIVWKGLDKPITREEVKKSLSKSTLEEPQDPGYWWRRDFITREQHSDKIAWFVTHGFDNPLSVDVGVPELGCFPNWIVDDGNHRLASAIYKGDQEIDAEVAGSIDRAKELFGDFEVPDGGIWNFSEIWSSSQLDSKLLDLITSNRDRVRKACKHSTSCYEKSLQWAKVFCELGICGDVIQGTYLDQNSQGDQESVPHWYLELYHDNKRIIFDPTATQFNSAGVSESYENGLEIQRLAITDYEDWKDWI